MTQEQIIGSKLIAVFMGGKLQEMAEMDYIFFSKTNRPSILQLQYHTSWEWLMPVVEKIEALKNGPINVNKVWITINGCECGIWTYFDVNEILRSAGNDGKFRVKRRGESKIEATFLAVIDFITWYNEQLTMIDTESTFNAAAAQFPNTLKKLPDTELPEMHILYNPSGQKEYHEERKQRTLDREKITRTEASKRNAVLRDSGSDNRWILDITARV